MSNLASLPKAGHDGATVVNRNIEAGRGRSSHVHSASQSHLCAVCCAFAPAYQEMLHGRHWPMMLVKLQHDARAVEVSDREGDHDKSIEVAVVLSGSVGHRCRRIIGVSGNLRELGNPDVTRRHLDQGKHLQRRNVPAARPRGLSTHSTTASCIPADNRPAGVLRSFHCGSACDQHRDLAPL